MDKEREIEKMVSIAREYGEEVLKSTGEYADIYDDMTALYEAGYRKIIPNVDFVVRAGELATMREKAYIEGRRAAAKEILDKLLTIMPHGYEQVKAFVRIREEEYGVEVD